MRDPASIEELTRPRNGQRWRQALVVTFMAATLVAVASPASGEIPTATDFAACNADAQSAVRTGSAIPTTKDHTHAEAARRGRAEVSSSTDPTGPRAPYSSDPQVVGMNDEGTMNATYQAAYRTCMRRRGF